MLHVYFALCTLMQCTSRPSHAKPLTAKKTWQRLQQQTLSATDGSTGSTTEKQIDRPLMAFAALHAIPSLFGWDTRGHTGKTMRWCTLTLHAFFVPLMAICSSRSWKASWISQPVARWLQKVSSHIQQTENTWKPTWGIYGKYSSSILG